MTTTPLTWLNEFLTNITTAGTQSDQSVTGLSNGNFLVTWRDTNDLVAPGAGADIVGEIFDALGNTVVAAKQINTHFDARQEADPAIAATNDGGYVLVYERSSGNDNDMMFHRYNAAGNSIGQGFVESDANSLNVYRDPVVSVRSDNTFVVTYERDNGSDEDIVARVVETNGSVGALQVLRSDDDPTGTTSDPIDPDSAVLTNDVVVTAFMEKDGTDYDIAIRLINKNDTLGLNANVNIDTVADSQPRVAALAGGGFVVIWNAANDIVGQIFTAGGVKSGGMLTLAGGADNQNEADVIGLEDGGFYVVWDNDTDSSLEGARFNAAGVAVGSQQEISINSNAPDNSIFGPDLSLTSDGRILVTWKNGEIYTEILDPRENVIVVDPSDGVTTGTQQSDTIAGSSSSDVIYGVGGNDDITGNGGADLIDGGGGNDNLLGNFGTDTIIGGSGNDAINGGSHSDSIDGGTGNDSIYASAGDFLDNVDGGAGIDELNHSAVLASDVSGAVFNFIAGTITSSFDTGTPTIVNLERYLDGAGGNTIIMGGGLTFAQGSGGNDTITGASTNDTIFGGNNNDVIDGGGGVDSIVGGGGNDTISGGNSYDDTLRGGSGDDEIRVIGGGLIEGNNGNDTFTVGDSNVIGDANLTDGDLVNGGAGIDTFDASNESSDSYTINLEAETLDKGTVGLRTIGIVNVENAKGGQGVDSIVGTSGINLLEGNGGNDILFGFGGDDTMSGNDGNDVVRGNAGNDIVGGEAGNDSVFGGEGNDSIYGGAGNDALSGGAGTDLLSGGGGFDTADYSGVTDNMVANINFAGAQAVSAQAGTDTYVSIEGILGGSGNDLLVGDSAGNLIDGGAGNDEIYGIGGSDILRGGSGNDQIEGSGGNDTMEGGSGGADVLSYYNSSGGVAVNLRFQGTAQAVGGASGTDTFMEFENLYGANAGGDILVGSTGNNRILGFGGTDQIYGFDGNDDLLGMQGNDTLGGGLGADTLAGGAGADIFDFNAVAESTAVSRDTITDFGVGGADIVDLSTIDANFVNAGNQTFSFIGAAGFSAAGQLRFATNGTNGFVLGDVNGDGTADLNILLEGVTSMNAGDFIF